ncbi:zinc-containing alcohol dehydrogenase [Rhypophila sp. PSN 637]
MKAIQVLGPKSNPQIVLNPSFPDLPPPSGSQILIKVYSAGITHDEITWPEVYKTASHIPGHDISGVITALGPSYAGPLKLGDEVYAMLHVDRGQGQAWYVLVDGGDEEVVRKPESLSHAQAAALPIPVLTAWEALFVHVGEERLGKEGARVLVTGASGAVGLILVQLARLKFGELEIVALASESNFERLRELGASECVDYRVPDWEEKVGKVDVVIDMAGGEVLSKAWEVVKSPGGVIVTVADPAPAWAFGKAVPEELETHPGVRAVYFVVGLNAEALKKVGELIDLGKIKALPVVEFPVEKALDAWEFAGKRSRNGKVVINFV